MISGRITLWSYGSIQSMYAGRIVDSCIYFAANLSCFVQSEWKQEAKIAKQTFA